MKKYTLFYAMLLISFGTMAQSVFLVEKQMPIKEASEANLLIFNVCKDLDKAEDDLDKFFKDRYDVKLKNNNKFSQIAEAASIPSISSHRGDLICYFHHTDTGNAAAIGFAKGYDIYLNSKDDAEGMTNFRNIIKDFMGYHFQNYYNDELKSIEKQLKNANQEVDKRESEINKLKKNDINLSKKIMKEDDPEKKRKMETEKIEDSNKVDILLHEIPPYRDQITTLEKDASKVRQDLNQYLSKIQTL